MLLCFLGTAYDIHMMQYYDNNTFTWSQHLDSEYLGAPPQKLTEHNVETLTGYKSPHV